MDKYVITQEPVNDATVILKPEQILDNNNAYKMVEMITAAQAYGYRYIIVDMAQLEFISSAGVGSLLGTVGESRANGGDIVLCNVSENIMNILNVLDLADFFTIRSDKDEAVAVGRV
ncbi:MAG: STAS domain-containing protein [candidate division Zixibacteria bacterium]|nr:STAS domain-containing protein [candidate division Zixibacteria bacterium]